MELFPNQIFVWIQEPSEFRLISPNEIANDFLKEDKAIEVRSEIIRTMLDY